MTIIAMTDFALRNWDADETGSPRIEGISPGGLVAACNVAVDSDVPMAIGYAPFCRHLFLANTSDTRCRFARITDGNKYRLRTGYRSRREGELAVLDRWFEGLEAPRALCLDVILYSHKQLVKEADAFPDGRQVPECDWGIVSVIGTMLPEEPPMPPITQMRNALGAHEGGSGVPIDSAKYAASVAFWNEHAVILSTEESE